MYVEFNKNGYEVLEDDGKLLKRFLSKSAATRWMNDMQEAQRKPEVGGRPINTVTAR